MLINESLKGRKVATVYGVIEFNEKGENDELTKEQQKALGKVKGFKFKEPKKATPKKSEPKKDTKTPTKKSEPKKDTKAPTKKTETKKSTPKKSEKK